jgi:hypothetical protein
VSARMGRLRKEAGGSSSTPPRCGVRAAHRRACARAWRGAETMAARAEQTGGPGEATRERESTCDEASRPVPSRMQAGARPARRRGWMHSAREQTRMRSARAGRPYPVPIPSLSRPYPVPIPSLSRPYPVRSARPTPAGWIPHPLRAGWGAWGGAATRWMGCAGGPDRGMQPLSRLGSGAGAGHPQAPGGLAPGGLARLLVYKRPCAHAAWILVASAATLPGSATRLGASLLGGLLLV